MAGAGSLARVQVFGEAREGGGGGREGTEKRGEMGRTGKKGLVSFPSFYINSGQN